MTADDPLRAAVAARKAQKLASLQSSPPDPPEEDAEDTSPQVNAGAETGKYPTPRTARQFWIERVRHALGIERNPL